MGVFSSRLGTSAITTPSTPSDPHSSPSPSYSPPALLAQQAQLLHQPNLQLRNGSTAAMPLGLSESVALRAGPMVRVVARRAAPPSRIDFPGRLYDNALSLSGGDFVVRDGRYVSHSHSFNTFGLDMGLPSRRPLSYPKSQARDLLPHSPYQTPSLGQPSEKRYQI